MSAHVSAPCVIGVGHLSLQADGKVAFEEPGFFVVGFEESAFLPQVYVAFTIFYQHIVHVVFVVVLFILIKTHFVTFVGLILIALCCNDCGVPVYNILSAKTEINEKFSVYRRIHVLPD